MFYRQTILVLNLFVSLLFIYYQLEWRLSQHGPNNPGEHSAIEVLSAGDVLLSLMVLLCPTFHFLAYLRPSYCYHNHCKAPQHFIEEGLACIQKFKREQKLQQEKEQLKHKDRIKNEEVLSLHQRRPLLTHSLPDLYSPSPGLDVESTAPTLQCEFCDECLLPKYLRMKHCFKCQKCVHKYDHHCFLLNLCIGEFNQKYYLGFLCTLVYNSVLYESYLLFWIKKQVSIDSNGIEHLSNKYFWLAMIITLLSLVLLLGLYLTGLHIGFWWNGSTTYEKERRPIINYFKHLKKYPFLYVGAKGQNLSEVDLNLYLPFDYGVQQNVKNILAASGKNPIDWQLAKGTVLKNTLCKPINRKQGSEFQLKDLRKRNSPLKSASGSGSSLSDSDQSVDNNYVANATTKSRESRTIRSNLSDKVIFKG